MHPVNNNNLNRQQQNPIQPIIQPIHPENFYNYGAVPNVFINNDNINENINNMQNMQNQMGNPIMGNPMIGNPQQNMFMNNPIQQQMFMNPMQQQIIMQQQHQNFMMQQQMMQQQQQFMIQQAVHQAVQQQLPIIQPIIQPPVARMRNVENLVKIQEYESSEEEPIKQQPIKCTKLTSKSKGKRKGVSLDDVMEQEQDLGNPARKQLVPTAKFKTNGKSIEDDMEQDLENPARKREDEIAKQKEATTVDLFLANIFDKSLDANKFKEPTDKSFMSKKNNSNVINSISPKNPDKAHFNKDTHPDEVYNVKFIGYEDEVFEIKALDINSYGLETHKYIYEYNKSFVGKVHNTNKLIGFIYARSSSDNTVSIETQRQVCFKFARDNNIKLCDFGFQFDNNISARNMNNIKHELGFWKEYIEDGSHVIIYSVDRLSRHLSNGMKFLDEMVARGITFHFVTNELKYGPESNATQKGMIQTLLIEAEKFSNMTSEKVKTTRKRLIAEGNELGPAKYGFKVVLVNGIRKKLLCQEEQENIRKIKEKYQDVSDNFEDYQRAGNVQRSFLSIYRFIERWCVRSGIKYRKGQPFSDLKIREIVKYK
jgi:DNA invertase Pin-like site-specific DNA recombinase